LRTKPNDNLGLAEREPHVPERTCVLTRRKGTKGELIRLALGPDGQVAPDVRARAPGRGAWIGLSRDELDVDETLSQLLVAEGFTSMEEVAYVQPEEIASIEGLDEDIATELQSRATEALERREAASREERRKLGVSDDLAALPHLTEAMLVTLGKANIRTLDDLADLATDELVQKKRVEPRRREPSNRPEDKGGILAEYALSEEQGNEIIMAARAHWFEDEAPAQTEEAADAESSQ
jgi:N utilization substance protein A